MAGHERNRTFIFMMDTTRGTRVFLVVSIGCRVATLSFSSLHENCSTILPNSIIMFCQLNYMATEIGAYAWSAEPAKFPSGLPPAQSFMVLQIDSDAIFRLCFLVPPFQLHGSHGYIGTDLF